MTVSEKYRFSDFTMENYKQILELAKKNYVFRLFTDEINKNEKIILLRHDIEFSIPIALEMAEMEAELGIKATYLLQVHGDFYNALEKENFKKIKKIISLGHQIGLHFDAHFWDINSEYKLEKRMKIDKELIEQYFDVKVYVFSFHNTNKFILSCEKDKYAEMINIYSKLIKEYGYCSDSTGYWRYEVLEERLGVAEDKVFQILIHDAMWQKEVLPPRQRIFKVIDENTLFLKQSYDDTLKRFEAKNIDWEGEV